MPARIPKPRLPTLNPSHPLADGLVGAWLAYEGAGARARDLSNSIDGELQGDAGWVNESEGMTLDLPGTSTDYVEIPANSKLEVTNVTVVARVIVDALIGDNGTEGAVFEKTIGGGTNESYLLFVDASLWSSRVVIGNSLKTAQGSTVNTGEVVDIAMTHDGNELTQYLNGQVDGTPIAASGDIDTGSGIANIGRLPGAPTRFILDGHVFFCYVYDRGLPAPAIQELHYDPYAAFRPLRRYWPAVEAAAPGGDPEGPLVGGKLTHGILTGGRLVR